MTVPSIARLMRLADWDGRLCLTDEDRNRMTDAASVLTEREAAGERIYGVTQGFGPLVGFATRAASADLGMGLISHLGVGQGRALAPEVTRFMVWLRLEGMKHGHSGVAPERWLRLADLWNRRFTPVVPREGTVSASGDLTPLAHAALAYAGVGEVWVRAADGWSTAPAAAALSDLSSPSFDWGGREALAFVNGTSASLSVICHNHRAIALMTRAASAVTGRVAWLLGANDDAYSEKLATIRGHEGHARAAEWIRAEILTKNRDPARPLQEPYSLRCAPQVIGAVLDHLDAQEGILVREATGCTDNPVVADGSILHGGNFHAAPGALCSDLQALLVHQIAFLSERQLTLLLDPARNGGRPPMLTPRPGQASGLAGVQLAATAMVARIRQLALPASLTALPTNLGNQDIVPMALNGATACTDMIDLAWLVLGSVALAVAQLTYLCEVEPSPGTFWAKLQDGFRPVVEDRPLAEEVRGAATAMKEAANGWGVEV